MAVMMENWRDVFVHWPSEMPHRGVVVTKFDEQIPFSSFGTSSTFLYLERQTPDSLGARSIVLAYDQISALKITDVVKPKTFQELGFEPPAAKRGEKLS